MLSAGVLSTRGNPCVSATQCFVFLVQVLFSEVWFPVYVTFMVAVLFLCLCVLGKGHCL